MNTKLHAMTDANGRPISLFMTAGQVSDYIGAAAMLDSLITRPVRYAPGTSFSCSGLYLERIGT